MVVEWIGRWCRACCSAGLYALFAIGLSLMFGVMRLTNVGHGDLIILAAFGAFAIAQASGAPPWVAMLVLLPLAFGAGYALQRGVLNATLGKDPLPSLVATFGVSIVLQNLLLETFTADPRSLEAGALQTASIPLVDGLAVARCRC
jgi:branched-chain amino acid transport system permease protein